MTPNHALQRTAPRVTLAASGLLALLGAAFFATLWMRGYRCDDEVSIPLMAPWTVRLSSAWGSQAITFMPRSHSKGFTWDTLPMNWAGDPPSTPRRFRIYLRGSDRGLCLPAWFTTTASSLTALFLLFRPGGNKSPRDITDGITNVA